MDLHKMRVDYDTDGIEPADLAKEPMEQFGLWFDDARAANIVEANAFVLSTANAKGAPSSRNVLLKKFDESGFVFFTNYQSRKSKDLEDNPKVAATFSWLPLQRQINIRGTAKRVSAADSDAYWDSRKKRSQVGSVISSQSEVVNTRATIDERHLETSVELAGEDTIPRPDWWGGWLIVPEQVEFWKGRKNRIHDRLRYTDTKEKWLVERLWP